jgi:hypothetical protein
LFHEIPGNHKTDDRINRSGGNERAKEPVNFSREFCIRTDIGQEKIMKAVSVQIFSIWLGLGLLLSGPVAFAQMGGGQSMENGMGQGMNGKNMPKYDPSTVVNVTGTIQEVQQATMPSGHGHMGAMNHMGTHLTLKTDNGTYTVLAGPSSFTKNKGFEFNKGDQIEVTGSKVKYNSTEALIAREIKKGGKTLTLRNEQGIPEWSMSRRR